MTIGLLSIGGLQVLLELVELQLHGGIQLPANTLRNSIADSKEVVTVKDHTDGQVVSGKLGRILADGVRHHPG